MSILQTQNLSDIVTRDLLFNRYKNTLIMDRNNFEVIIIGGSYAGLSAAMALGRSLRNVLIIDSGLPCNRQTPHSHNFITQDGQKPGDIAKKAKAEVMKYNTISFLNDTAVAGTKSDDLFSITTLSGKLFRAKKLILATGITDNIPAIKGFAECWGISVVHCPYCHGFEFKDKNTAILAEGARAIHLASLVNNLTGKLTLITTGKEELTDEQRTKLKRHAINIIDTPLIEIEHEHGILNNLIFADGTVKPFDVLYAALPFAQHSDIAQSLGCEFTEQGYIKVTPLQETTVNAVFACGDNSNMMRSLANAVYSGNLTGAVVNGKLAEDTF